MGVEAEVVGLELDVDVVEVGVTGAGPIGVAPAVIPWSAGVR